MLLNQSDRPDHDFPVWPKPTLAETDGYELRQLAAYTAFLDEHQYHDRLRRYIDHYERPESERRFCASCSTCQECVIGHSVGWWEGYKSGCTVCRRPFHKHTFVEYNVCRASAESKTKPHSVRCDVCSECLDCDIRSCIGDRPHSVSPKAANISPPDCRSKACVCGRTGKAAQTHTVFECDEARAKSLGGTEYARWMLAQTARCRTNYTVSDGAIKSLQEMVAAAQERGHIFVVDTLDTVRGYV